MIASVSLHRRVLVSLAALALSNGAQAQSAACDSACLKGFVGGYFEALAARDPRRDSVTPS